MPTEMLYQDIAIILREYGWTERTCEGSHRVWTKPDTAMLTIKVFGNGNVDPAAIRQVAKLARDGLL